MNTEFPSRQYTGTTTIRKRASSTTQMITRCVVQIREACARTQGIAVCYWFVYLECCGASLIRRDLIANASPARLGRVTYASHASRWRRSSASDCTTVRNSKRGQSFRGSTGGPTYCGVCSVFGGCCGFPRLSRAQAEWDLPSSEGCWFGVVFCYFLCSLPYNIVTIAMC